MLSVTPKNVKHIQKSIQTIKCSINRLITMSFLGILTIQSFMIITFPKWVYHIIFILCSEGENTEICSDRATKIIVVKIHFCTNWTVALVSPISTFQMRRSCLLRGRFAICKTEWSKQNRSKWVMTFGDLSKWCVTRTIQNYEIK